MPHQPTVSEESEFDGLPDGSPDQDAILIGRVNGDSEFNGLAAYYIHGRGSILLGRYEDREFIPSTVSTESRLMSACVREFSRADVETELSSVGNSLLQAWHFGDLTPLSHKQAHVYRAPREGRLQPRRNGCNPQYLAQSTVDTHLQRATEKLAAAENPARFVRVDSDELADADPEFFDEAGVGDDANRSNDITRSRKRRGTAE